MAIIGNRNKPADGPTEAKAEAATANVERRMVESDDRPQPATPTKAPRVRKELPDVDFGSLQEIQTTPDLIRALKPVKGNRTPQQEQTDELVRKAHAKWVTAGRDMKATFDGKHTAAISTLRVTPEHVEALRYRLQQSATFLQYRLRFGKQDEKLPGVVMFYVTDRPEKKKTEVAGQTAL